MTTESTLTNWKLLYKEVKRRFTEPWCRPEFVMYFLAAIVGLGGTGVWVELVKFFMTAAEAANGSAPFDPLRSALVTFFPAMAGASCMQLVLAVDDKGMKALALLVLIFSIGLAIILSTNLLPELCIRITALAGCLIGFAAWWIANADLADLKGINPEDSLGPPPSTSLQGDLDGYTT